MSDLHIQPISLREANEFVKSYYRHHKPTVGHNFSVSCVENEKIEQMRFDESEVEKE